MSIFGCGKSPTYKSLRDLSEKRAENASTSSIMEARKSVRILLIDDQEFSALHNLKNNGFNVIRIEGIDRIEEVQDYPVVMVDLQGVGKTLNPTGQGAHLIQQTKKLYPEKYVIAYTGGATAALTSLAVEFADKYTTKDINVEKWCEYLDAAVQEVANPVAVWGKFRHRLLNQGVTPIQLAELEDAYVRGLLENPKALSNSVATRAIKAGIGVDVRNIIDGLIANVIFTMIAQSSH